MSIAYKTHFGEAVLGNCRDTLLSIDDSSVNLIFTSPPFALLKGKQYGNASQDSWLDWFREFVPEFRRVLRDDGSLVLDIGGAWTKGEPTKSLYNFRLPIMLVDEYDFHLCQDFYWWNVTSIPTPTEWVNKRKIRVKRAVNNIWWMGKTPWVKASNQRVLWPYSDSMKSGLEKPPKINSHPSGHRATASWAKKRDGSIPPNLIAVANAASNTHYTKHCKANNLPIHPARFPYGLPEFFLNFLTDPGDFVVDPFGGSCTTGWVAENMKRRWLCCDTEEDYLRGSKCHFFPETQPLPKVRKEPYLIPGPNQIIDSTGVPLSTGKR